MSLYSDGSQKAKITPYPWLVTLWSGGEDDDRGGGDLRPVLVAVSHLFHRDGTKQATEQVEVDPAGLSFCAVVGHELHDVQPDYILLLKQQVIQTHLYIQIYYTESL